MRMHHIFLIKEKKLFKFILFLFPPERVRLNFEMKSKSPLGERVFSNANCENQQSATKKKTNRRNDATQQVPPMHFSSFEIFAI